MALGLLDTPLRLSWDFAAAAGGAVPGRLAASAARIAEAGVFFVTLQGRPLHSAVLAELLDVLGGCQVQASCRGSAAELQALTRLPRAACSLLLDAAEFVTPGRGVDAGRLAEVVLALRANGFEPQLALTPLRHNLCNIPDLLRFCSDLQVAGFKLPNAHIGDSFNDYSPAELPRWQDLQAFRELWHTFRQNCPPLPVMEIHDLFLWEIMTPGEQQNRSEYGGCQAGNSLGHIDCQGVVHPCAAWPHPLGRLPEQSLEDIWAGHERLAVRARIAQTPPGCRGCRDLEMCFGGCRGLAKHLNPDAGQRDLMCAGPR